MGGGGRGGGGGGGVGGSGRGGGLGGCERRIKDFVKIKKKKFGGGWGAGGGGMGFRWGFRFVGWVGYGGCERNVWGRG